MDKKKILKYVLTPQLVPRIRDLFFSGFSYMAFFMAQVYRSVRLLPEAHPYLNPANMGRYGLRHVIAEAGNNLEFRRENIDQVAIFFLMLLGLILIAAQFFMLFAAGFVETAHAGGAALLYNSSSPLDFFKYFRTPDAQHELAFVLMDRVFGIPANGPGTSFFSDQYGKFTCVVKGDICFDLGQTTRSAQLTPDKTIYGQLAIDPQGQLTRSGAQSLTFPWPFHNALRGMLQVYSVGLLVIGAFIFMYFAFALAAETAQTGTPFGRHFNALWAPFRIVLAMGLLVPIAHGLNSAQWILLYAAKWGSSFATNGWIIYSTSLSTQETLAGARNTLIATPNAPPVNTLMEFGSVLATCKLAYESLYARRATRPPVTIDAWLVNPRNTTLQPLLLTNTSFQQAVTYFDRGMIHVRFGERRDQQQPSGGHQTWEGAIAPLCGELTLDLTYAPPPGAMTEPGSFLMLKAYYDLIGVIWNDASQPGAGGIRGLNNIAQINFREIGQAMYDRHISISTNPNALLPTPEQLSSLPMAYARWVATQIDLAVIDQRTSPEWQEQLTRLGWGGAAIWYNKIAQLNGGLVSAVYAMPTVKRYPHLMEETRRRRTGSDSDVSGEKRHRVYRSTDDPLPFNDPTEQEIAKAMFQTVALWLDNYSSQPRTTNAFIDAINAVFGTQGLFNITKAEAANIHPLAQLASIGRSIVDSAIRNLGYSAAAGLGGGLANLMQQHLIGRVSFSVGSFFFQIATIGLTIGFVLFYVIPFLPFIYFFFAVGGWVKSIFEAMVGVPLWALAHIRIDGHGLPGDAAMSGYYLILEIFLRPILIIFGFIASMIIFAAQVNILHDVWSLIVSNVSGFGTAAAPAPGGAAPATQTGSMRYLRGAVDEFFYTVMYAVFCYMMGMSSFKLIDLVPNHILRWMGASISTFGERSGDPAQNLVSHSLIGAQMVANPLKQAAGGALGGAQQGMGAIGGLAGRSGGR